MNSLQMFTACGLTLSTLWFLIVFADGSQPPEFELYPDQFPSNAGKTLKTNYTYGGRDLYIGSFLYPLTSSVQIPQGAKGQVINLAGAMNVTAQRGVGTRPMQNWTSGLTLTARTNVTGRQSIIQINPNIVLDGNNINLEFNRMQIKGTLPTITINYAQCFIWFV